MNVYLVVVLIVLWGVTPCLKNLQSSDMNPIVLTCVQSLLCFALSIPLLFALTQVADRRALTTQSWRWWAVSITIAALTVGATWVFFALTKKSGVQFLAYVKPLSMLLTFVILGQEMSANKKWGVLLIGAGIYAFSRG